MVVPLDDLQEDRGSVLNRFGEDLEQVAFLIKIHQDLQFLEERNRSKGIPLCHPHPCKTLHGAGLAPGKPFPCQAGFTHSQLVDVLLHFDFGSFQPLPQHLVVAGWDIHELHTPLLHVGDLQGRGDPGVGQAWGWVVAEVCVKSIAWDGQCQEAVTLSHGFGQPCVGTCPTISLWAPGTGGPKVPSPGNAESLPLCKDASPHPDPPEPLEALWSGEKPKTKRSAAAGLNPEQHLPQAEVGDVLCWLSPAAL